MIPYNLTPNIIIHVHPNVFINRLYLSQNNVYANYALKTINIAHIILSS